jgi:hypothetical protein
MLRLDNSVRGPKATSHPDGPVNKQESEKSGDVVPSCLIHYSLPNPRVRYRIQHIRQKIHGDVGQSNGQDAALDQVVVAV